MSKPDDKAVCQAKTIAKGYQGIKFRCKWMQKNKAVILRKLEVSTEQYMQSGEIRYNHKLAAAIPERDKKDLEQYGRDMKSAWILERGVASIQNERTRAIAEDTLLKGKSCEDLTWKYGMTSRGIRKQKLAGIMEVACFMKQ